LVRGLTTTRHNMTRINVVPVTTLCDQHLMSEHRELKRIPNCLLKGILQYNYPDRPADYVLGAGHVKFFTNKLGWLYNRYNELHKECLLRGFNVSYQFRNLELIDAGLKMEDWEPTPAAVKLSQERITEKMPVKARFTSYK
jgi:deoxyribonuclease (pyrimidine dimer)